jgi:hypothetical protein
MVIDKNVPRRYFLTHFRDALAYISRKMLDESKSPKFYANGRIEWPPTLPIDLEIWSFGFGGVEYGKISTDHGYAVLPFDVKGGHMNIILPMNHHGVELINQFKVALNEFESLQP